MYVTTEMTESVPDARFTDLFLAEYPRVVRQLQAILGDREAARDVAQEAFVRLYVHWRKVSQYDRPGAWVRRVALRLASNSIRARRAHRDALARLHLPQLVEDSEPSSDITWRRAVLSLPRAQRVATVLYYLEDLALGEVAEAIGCSESTVRVHLHRARRRLRQIFNEVKEVDDGAR